MPLVPLPRPPWAQPRERCPRCLAKVVDEHAVACSDCGYQLRLPRSALVGLVLVTISLGSFFLSAFGGFLFPWPTFLYGLPILNPTTPSDLASLFLWLGSLLFLSGILLAGAGAYAVRRRGEKAGARGPGAA